MEMKKIGKRLFALREINKYSFEDIAAFCNTTVLDVTSWEDDECYPTMDSIIKLSQIYSMSTDDLLERYIQPRKLRNFQIVCYMLSLIMPLLLLIPTLNNPSNNYDVTLIFTGNFQVYKLIYLFLISMSLMYIVIQSMFVTNSFKSERSYHRTSALITCLSLFTALSFTLSVNFSSDKFETLPYVILSYLFISIYHLYYVKTSIKKEKTVQRTRKIIAMVYASVYFMQSLIFLIMQDSIYDGAHMMIMMLLLLGISISTPLIKEHFFKDRYRSMLLVGAPFIVFGIGVFFEVLSDGFVDAVITIIVVYIVISIPALIMNYDIVVKRIKNRLDVK